MYIYCLFCETGKSRYVIREAEAKFRCRAISPRQIQHTWSRGRMTDREREMLPGYVFLYFEEERPDPVRLRSLHGVIRCLRDSSQNCELRGRDELFALMILDRDGIIGKTRVTETDGFLEIAPESFGGTDAEIIRVDRRNSRMQVEIGFHGETIRTWIEYEIAEPEVTEPEVTEQEGIEESNGADN